MQIPTLYVRQTNGRYRVAHPSAVTAAASEVMQQEFRRGPVLNSPDTVRRFLRARMAYLEHEIFGMIVVDNRNRVIDYKDLFRGTIDGSSVHPREVVKEVLALNGAAVILAHNHPSGSPEPSQADEVITRRLKSALALLDIRVLDHLVVTRDSCVSFAERGLL